MSSLCNWKVMKLSLELQQIICTCFCIWRANHSWICKYSRRNVCNKEFSVSFIIVLRERIWSYAKNWIKFHIHIYVCECVCACVGYGEQILLEFNIFRGKGNFAIIITIIANFVPFSLLDLWHAYEINRIDPNLLYTYFTMESKSK